MLSTTSNVGFGLLFYLKRTILENAEG